jgi:hypothetical protein
LLTLPGLLQLTTPTMKLAELIILLRKAELEVGHDADVLLYCEPIAMEEGYDKAHAEGITDIRLVDDWPLPGESLLVQETEKSKKIVIFYDDHDKLSSSIPSIEE